MNAADDGSAVSGGSAASQVRISPHWSSTPRYVRIGTTTPPRPTRCTNYIALATLWRGGRVSYRLYEIFVDEDVQIPCHNSGSLSEGDYGAIVTSLGFEAHMKCEAMPARQRHVLQSRQVRAGRLYRCRRTGPVRGTPWRSSDRRNDATWNAAGRCVRIRPHVSQTGCTIGVAPLRS